MEYLISFSVLAMVFCAVVIWLLIRDAKRTRQIEELRSAIARRDHRVHQVQEVTAGFLRSICSQAWEASQEYTDDCVCGWCDYCVEVAGDIDQKAPDFEKWFNLKLGGTKNES